LSFPLGVKKGGRGKRCCRHGRVNITSDAMSNFKADVNFNGEGNLRGDSSGKPAAQYLFN
jgi:hypothetical protein